MPQRVLGVYGTAQGALVCIAHLRKPRLQVTNLAPGGRVVLTLESGESTEFREDGEFPIPETRTARLHSFDATDSLMCYFVT